MKILLVVHQFFPDFTAGTEVLTFGVARDLRERGHEVRIMTGYPSLDDLTEAQRCDRYRYEGFEIYRFHHAYVPMAGQTSMLEVGSDNRLATQYFSNILIEFEPERVHYFHFNRLGTGLILAAEAAGILQSMTPTDFWVVCPTAQLRYSDGRLCDGPSRNAGNCAKHFAQNPARSWPVRAMARALPTPMADLLVQAAQAPEPRRVPFVAEVQAIGRRLPKTVDRLNRLQSIVAPNGFIRAKLVEYGIDPTIIVDVAFGVDLPSKPAADNDTASDMLRIGFIGTLAPHKGAHVLVEAFRRLEADAGSLRIHGNVTEFPDYSASLFAAAAGVQNVDFAGVFRSSAIFEVLDAIDVLVVPSLWYENTPLVIYSAQAARKIVVASDFPGISGVVQHDVDGLLFTPGDAGALARQLERLAASPSLRERLRANVRPPKSIATYVTELLQVWRIA